MNELFSFYAGKKVFLTGHTGFKGTWLSRILLQAGAEVTGFALNQAFLFRPVRLDRCIRSAAISAMVKNSSRLWLLQNLTLCFILRRSRLCALRTAILWVPMQAMSWGRCTFLKLCGRPPAYDPS